MKRVIILFVLLLLPTSSAFAWTSPLRSELGTFGNPLQVRITNVSDFRPPQYCGYLPGFASRWFSECAPVIAQRNLQTTLTQINNSLEAQNRAARDAQLRSIVFPIRSAAPVYVAPAPVVKNTAPTNPTPDTAAIQSIIDQVSAAVTPTSPNCDAAGNCWGSAAGGSL